MSAAARKTILTAGGVGVTVAGTYLGLKVSAWDANMADPACFCGCTASPDRNGQYERVAATYDQYIGRDEWYMGINIMRRFLLQHARGDVLEVGCGTGRNLPHYNPNKVRRLVLTDQSPAMLQQAQEKVKQQSKNNNIETVTLLQDASQLNFPDHCFDTVVDTFGLCSYNEPVKVLKQLGRLCKPDGTILLLEHGRSHTWSFISHYLDKHADQHAARWGCVWNRDMDELLQESGLELVSLRQFHFGTTYYVVCRPQNKVVQQEQQVQQAPNIQQALMTDRRQ